MQLHNRRYLLAVLIVVVLGAVIGWSWRDWPQLGGRGQVGAVSWQDVSLQIEAGVVGDRSGTMPITPGTWTWQRKDGHSAALFADGLVTAICDLPAGTVTIARRGEVADDPAVTIMSSTQNRTFRGHKSGRQIVVTLAAGDPFLDALALSRGRFGFAVAGLDAVYPSSWAEVARVIEDCRPPPAS